MGVNLQIVNKDFWCEYHAVFNYKDMAPNILEHLLSNFKFCNYTSRILDYGFGNGNNLRMLCRLFKNIDACDISKGANFHDFLYNKNVKLSKIYNNNLPYETGKFDVIILSKVISTIDNMELIGYVTEFKRILNKEGIIIILDYCFDPHNIYQ